MHATVTDTRGARAARLRGLYAVTPDLADNVELRERVDAAITGGARAVQYRNKTATRERRALQARLLAELCRSRDVLYIVNDDVELAAEVGADGVHLGRDDGDPNVARLILGPGPVIGVFVTRGVGRWPYAHLATAQRRLSRRVGAPAWLHGANAVRVRRILCYA